MDLAFGLALAFPAFFFLFKPANNPFAAASPGIGTQVGKFKTFDMFPKPQPFRGNHISTSIVGHSCLGIPKIMKQQPGLSFGEPSRFLGVDLDELLILGIFSMTGSQKAGDRFIEFFHLTGMFKQLSHQLIPIGQSLEAHCKATSFATFPQDIFFAILRFPCFEVWKDVDGTCQQRNLQG